MDVFELERVFRRTGAGKGFSHEHRMGVLMAGQELAHWPGAKPLAPAR